MVAFLPKTFLSRPLPLLWNGKLIVFHSDRERKSSLESQLKLPPFSSPSLRHCYVIVYVLQNGPCELRHVRGVGRCRRGWRRRRLRQELGQTFRRGSGGGPRLWRRAWGGRESAGKRLSSAVGVTGGSAPALWDVPRRPIILLPILCSQSTFDLVKTLVSVKLLQMRDSKQISQSSNAFWRMENEVTLAC